MTATLELWEVFYQGRGPPYSACYFATANRDLALRFTKQYGRQRALGDVVSVHHIGSMTLKAEALAEVRALASGRCALVLGDLEARVIDP